MEVRHAQGTLENKVEFIERFCRDMNKTAVPQEIIGSLSNDDGDVNENGKKAIGLDRQRNNIARVSRFFVHFFFRHCMTTSWKCLSSRTVEDANTMQRLCFPFTDHRYSLGIQLQKKKYVSIWRIERVGIRAM